MYQALVQPFHDIKSYNSNLRDTNFQSKYYALRGAHDQDRRSISHLKQLILIKSRRQLLVRNFAHLGTSSVNWDHHGPLRHVIVETGLIQCWYPKSPRFFANRSYFRRFTVKIRSFAIFGALNPPKCPNKPKDYNH